MDKNNFATSKLVEFLATTEKDYFLEKGDRKGLSELLRNLKNLYVSKKSETDNDTEIFAMVSLFVILERLKRTILCENHLLSKLDDEIQMLLFNLEHFNENYGEIQQLNDNDTYENINSNIIDNVMHKSTLFHKKCKRSNYPKKISKVLKKRQKS